MIGSNTNIHFKQSTNNLHRVVEHTGHMASLVFTIVLHVWVYWLSYNQYITSEHLFLFQV